MSVEERVRRTLRAEGDGLPEPELTAQPLRPVTRQRRGPLVAVAVFAVVLFGGVVLSLGVLRSTTPASTTGSPESTSPLPTVLESWSPFQMDFESGSDPAMTAQLLWGGPDLWRFERDTPHDYADDEFLADLVVHQVIYRSRGEPIQVGSARDPNTEGIPLVLFTDPVAPAVAWQLLRPAPGLEPISVDPTHELATQAAEARSGTTTFRMEFTANGIPVLIDRRGEEPMRFNVTTLTDRAVERTDIISPDPVVRSYAQAVAPLVMPSIAKFLGDGIITLSELEFATEATLTCARDKIPSAEFLEKEYDPVQGMYSYSYRSTADDDAIGVALDQCGSSISFYINEVWQYQNMIIDDVIKVRLESFVPSQVDLETAQGVATEPMLIGEGERWRLEAFQKGPSVCTLVWTYRADGRPDSSPGGDQCFDPRFWETGLFAVDMATGDDAGNWIQGAILGLVDASAMTVDLTYEDGFVQTVDVLGREEDLPVAFFFVVFDVADHGLLRKATARLDDGSLFAEDVTYSSIRLDNEFGQLGSDEQIARCRESWDDLSLNLQEACDDIADVMERFGDG